jgi:amino acid transporter
LIRELKPIDAAAVFVMTLFGAFLINGAGLLGVLAFCIVIAGYIAFRLTEKWPTGLRVVCVSLVLLIPVLGLACLFVVAFIRRRNTLHSASTTSANSR